MSNDTSWQIDLEEYILEGEPDRAQRAGNWQTAIGLQAVDGLTTSDYLLETAKEHIDGRIDIAEAQRRIKSYYEEHASREEVEQSHEADTVSSRISEILGERAFTFSPTELRTIHRRLFHEVLPRSGEYRTYNITKKEWVLEGDTVYYASHGAIEETLAYDFAQERAFEYAGLGKADVVRHISSFTSDIWQIHPFSEGNTRTTAVFMIKYLRTMGYRVGNGPFERHSWFFRNALVRANYEDVLNGIAPTTRFLEEFFENLLYDAHNELKNRYLHIDWLAAREDARDARGHTGTDQVADQVTDQVATLLAALGSAEMSALELMQALGLSHRPTFRQNYLRPALEAGLIERTIPDKPTSRFQKYRAAKR